MRLGFSLVASLFWSGDASLSWAPNCDPQSEAIYNSLLDSDAYTSMVRARMMSDSDLLEFVGRYFNVPEDVSLLLSPTSPEEYPLESQVETTTSASADISPIEMIQAELDRADSSEVVTVTSESEVQTVVVEGESRIVIERELVHSDEGREEEKTDLPPLESVSSTPVFPELPAESELFRIGNILRLILDKLITNYVIADTPSEFVKIPLYLALVDAEYKTSSASDGATSAWIALLRQVHFRSVVAHSENDAEHFRRFGIVAQFCLEKLVAVTFRPNERPKLKEANAPDMKLGQVVIPGSVIDEAINVGWCCFLTCLRSLTATTTATPTTVSPTPDPSVALKRRAELTKYIQMVNQNIDSLNELIGKVKGAHAVDAGSEDFKSALSALRSTILESYSNILAASMMNEVLVLDLSATKTQFMSIADKVGKSFDESQYQAIILELPQLAETLRSTLLEAARS